MARWILWASSAALVGVAVLGFAGNAGGKFVRILPQHGCLASYVNIVNTFEPKVVCCTGHEDDHGVCVAGRNKATKILTSKWGFVIPVLALAVSAWCDRLAGGATASRTLARKHRLVLYVVIILQRTVLLYLALNLLQGLLQPENSTNCWYSQLRRNSRCSEQFDFADHIVLAVCQYFTIQVTELYCIVQEYYDRLATSTTAPATTPTAATAAASAKPASPPSPLLSVLGPSAVCVVVAVSSLLVVYDTATFFHSRAETVVALALSWFAVGWTPYLLESVGTESVAGSTGRGGGGGDEGRDGTTMGAVVAAVAAVMGLGNGGGRGGGGGRGWSSPGRGFFLAPLVG